MMYKAKVTLVVVGVFFFFFFFFYPYTRHKSNVIAMQNFLILNLAVRKVTGGL
jgi:hypothetical protein